jgi:hypothetical protein
LSKEEITDLGVARIVRKITPTGGYWPPSPKEEITNFGGGANCFFVTLFWIFFFLAHVEPELFLAFAHENSPVQPLPMMSFPFLVATGDCQPTCKRASIPSRPMSRINQKIVDDE